MDVRMLGCIAFDEALALQEQLVAQRAEGVCPDTLLLLEHPPTITLGRRGSHDDIYASPDALERADITVRATNRGGLVTYHGPGQIVGYLISRLSEIAGTAPAFVSGLEGAIMRVLADYQVSSFPAPPHRGVFTARGKIAAIGVGVRRGVTMHGFSLNVQPNLGHFALINPCGLSDLGVTSMERELGVAPTIEAVQQSLAFHIQSVFPLTAEAATASSCERLPTG